MKESTLILFVALILAATTAFECNKPPSDAGFNINTRIAVFVGGLPVQAVHSDVQVFGHWDSDTDLGTGTNLSTGTVFQFSGKTNSNGFFAVPMARAPANWEFGEFSGPCANKTFKSLVHLGENFVILCDTTCLFIHTHDCAPGRFFAVDPSFIDATNPPGSVIVTGTDIDATYGMPYVSFFDMNASVLAEGRAVTVSADGTWMNAIVPNIASVPSGTYWAIIRNVMADGTLAFLGSAEVFVFNYSPPPPPDPEPSPCGEGPCVIY